tara:strand:- start:1600 stop:2703 length:1104 start_codon:yes stop_codon:yes gene_type:complete
MNVLAVMPTYRSSRYSGKVGGGEISNRILLEGLASRGHSVTVCTLNPGHDQEAYRNGVKVIGTQVPNNESVIGKIYRIKRFKRLIEQTLLSNNMDFVLTGTYGIKPALFVAGQRGIPVAAFIRAFENFETFNNAVHFFRYIGKRLLYGDSGISSLKKVDYLLPNSQFMAEVCIRYKLESKIKVVYPALCVNNIIEVKKAHNVKNIFMVGPSIHKGFHLFKELANVFPELTFHVVGDSTIHSRSRYKYENLIFHGWENVVDILSKEADLLLVPSVCQEAFGRVAVEGLISGTPTLVSNIGGLPEAVHFESDLLVEPNNKEAWSKAIYDFIEDPYRVFLATKRAQKNLKIFSLENQVSILEEFMLDIVK